MKARWFANLGRTFLFVPRRDGQEWPSYLAVITGTLLLVLLARRSRNQKGMDTAFSVLRMFLSRNVREQGERRAFFCTATPGQDHRGTFLF